MGNIDASDHWMRLAGREYLRVTEDDRTPLPFIREAAVMAAKCFLSVENLKVASKGLRRAQAIETVLRADDDLMAGRHRRSGRTAPPPRSTTPPTEGRRRAPAIPVTELSSRSTPGSLRRQGARRGRLGELQAGADQSRRPPVAASGSANPDRPTTSPDLVPWPPPCRVPIHVVRGAPRPSLGAGVVSDVDVLLTTEGTYPYVTGGVSTWAHQLVTGLAEKQFVVYSVVANTSMAVRYEPPPNLAHVVQVPLWGTEDNAEFNPRPGWIARRMRRPGTALRPGVPPRLRPAGGVGGPGRRGPRRPGGARSAPSRPTPIASA